jgi:BirA family transcriptional regulator, biotin operon repressor / biotin---[acetyl-CoA-carboxylase] ligase
MSGNSAGDSAFDHARFGSGLVTRRLGRTLLARAAAGSTNDVAWEALAQGAPDGTAVVADAQTRGRGRAGRAWHTAPGRGLALSLLLSGTCEPGALALLPLVAGLAAARALQGLGARPALKWPNDVLLDGRKVAGILCEARRAPDGDPRPGRGPHVAVVGIGVDVAQRTGDFPPELAPLATSLALAGVTTDRETVAAAFCNALEPLWTALAGGDAAARAGLLAAWSGFATCWGREVEVREGAGTARGTALRLAPDGALVLRDAAGAEVVVRAGDLVTEGA